MCKYVVVYLYIGVHPYICNLSSAAKRNTDLGAAAGAGPALLLLPLAGKAGVACSTTFITLRRSVLWLFSKTDCPNPMQVMAWPRSQTL